MWILFFFTNAAFIGAMTFLVTKATQTTIQESIARRHLSVWEIAYRQFEYVTSIILGQGSGRLKSDETC